MNTDNHNAMNKTENTSMEASELELIRFAIHNAKSLLSDAEKFLDKLQGIPDWREEEPSLTADFIEWASDFFHELGDNVNTYVVREFAFKDFDFKYKKGWKTQKFTNALRAFCKTKGYTYNPEQLINTTSGAARIMHKVEDRTFDQRTGSWQTTGRLVPKDMIYIKTTG